MPASRKWIPFSCSLAWGLISLAGCVSAGPSTEASKTTPDAASSIPASDLANAGASPELSPIDATLKEAFGADLGTIFRAVLLARRTSIADCMSRSGWVMSEAELDTIFASYALPATTIVDDIDRISAEIEAGVTTSHAASAPEGDDKVRTAHRLGCITEAERSFPNPNDRIIASLEQFDSDVTARVLASAEVSKAEADRRECYATLGSDLLDGGDPTAALSGRLVDIQVGAYSGQLTAEEAVRRLRDLRAEAVLVERCNAPYDDAFRTTTVVVQEQALRANPQLIPGIVEQVEESVERYRDLIDEVEQAEQRQG